MSLNNLTDAEYYRHIQDHGHVLKLNERGFIDHFGLDYEHHNGAFCVRCCDAWCVHCRDPVERCVESYTPDLPFPTEGDA